MHIDFLRDVFREHARDDALAWGASTCSYAELQDAIDANVARFEEQAIGAGSVVALHGDFTPHAVAALLALVERAAIVVPIAPGSEASAARFGEIAGASLDLRFDDGGSPRSGRLVGGAPHPLYAQLRERAHPGLVLFSSGSTGEPKAVVHDVERLLRKYRRRRHCYRTLALLLFDHIGGLDTGFYSLANGSCLVLPEDRSPDAVCRAIEAHRVEVLPAAPSFLNLLWVSDAWRRHDLASLRIVTYGAEVMSRATLERCRRMFPGVEMMQKYGTSEVGTLRSKSRDSGSLWVKLGGEGYETRVVDGRLEIKAESSMLGYLNAPSPFTPDGWFKTGDAVEQDGDYLRFLGRDSDVINVGGQKVHPSEVESVIAGLDGMREVVVYPEANSLMGEIVCALVRTVEREDPKALERRVRAACREQLDAYKVPMKVEATDEPIATERFKLRRRTRS